MTFAAHRAGRLEFYGLHQSLADAQAFADFLQPLHQIDWVVYAKRPFSGPASVLADLARYSHRVALSNNRLLAHDNDAVTFKWKDYRAKVEKRYKTLRLTPDEFIRRFLLHVLPTRFHRIRHFGLFANHQRALTVQQIRSLLVEDTALPEKARNGSDGYDTPRHPYRCPACGAPMRVIEIFGRGHAPRVPPT